MLKKIKQWLISPKLFVYIDPADNSITLSKALFKHMKNNVKPGDEPKVFVFKLSHTDNYAFMVNPNIKQPTQLCTIQYNEKYKCVGFESLCPSVGKIAYSYGLSHNKPTKLTVSTHVINQNVDGTIVSNIYYQLEKPCRA